MREYYFIRLAKYTIADGTDENIVWRGEAVDTEDDDAVCRAYKAAMAALREVVVGNALSGPLFCCRWITTIMLCGPVDAAIRDTDGEYTTTDKIVKVVKIY
jgi:hypothetical protein